MRGNNILILNSATIIEAIQEYFDRRFAKDTPNITGVSMDGSNPSSFRVTVEEKKIVVGGYGGASDGGITWGGKNE